MSELVQLFAVLVRDAERGEPCEELRVILDFFDIVRMSLTRDDPQHTDLFYVIPFVMRAGRV